jgi:uncharacterized membrane-anchored protein
MGETTSDYLTHRMPPALAVALGGIALAAALAVPAVAHWRFGLNAILAFWFAYIVTRPVGASFADWMAVSHKRGGLGWGTGPVTLVLAAVIVGFVGYLTATRKDVRNEHIGSPS